MVEVDAARDAGFGFPPGDVSSDESATIDRACLRQGEQRRQDRRGWMSTQRVAAIVEVECVRGGTVDQRRIERRDTL